MHNEPLGGREGGKSFLHVLGGFQSCGRLDFFFSFLGARLSALRENTHSKGLFEKQSILIFQTIYSLISKIKQNMHLESNASKKKKEYSVFLRFPHPHPY